MTEYAYLNGELVPVDEARISVLDYGFLFGYGLYETLRGYEGKLFRLDDHLMRLNDSARTLGIALDVRTLREAALRTVRANCYPQTRVRITVTLGKGTMTPDIRSCATPTVLILAGEYHPFPQTRYEQGYNAVVSSIRRNSRSPVTLMKSANSLENMLARQEARHIGADEALFINDRGHLTEASGSNVFFVNEGIIATPRLKAGILPGVTRAAVFEVAKSEALILRQINILPHAIFEAEEAFLTNSLIEVMPLTVVDGTPIGDGKPGVVTRQLMDSYRDLVKRELREQ